MKVGDYVQVKDGIKDPEYLTYDFSGFRGVVTEIEPANNSNEEVLVGVKWDIRTLKKLPKEYIAKSVDDGYEIDVMNLLQSDFILLSEKCKDDPQERIQLVEQLEDAADLINTPYGLILGKQLQVNADTLVRYRAYLLKNLTKPLLLTGREDFRWEERYVFGGGSKRQYEELKKTHPSYTDTYTLIKLLNADVSDTDLFVKVKRVSDKKQFELGLSWLESVDKKTNNGELLDHFASWVVNYQ